MKEHLQYHIDLAECQCDSPYPIGACCYCDMKAAQEQIRLLTVALDEMHFAYINKDGEFPHQFETEALESYKKAKEVI